MLSTALLALSTALVFSGVQPQLTEVGDRLFLAFASDDVISVAASGDGGRTFGAPARLPAGGRLALGMHRGPRIAATDRAVLVTAVIGAKGGGADGDVRLFRSLDGGATWAPSLVINDVTGSAREGLHGMAATPEGMVVVTWLDLRQPGTQVYAAVSRDHGATWAPDVLVHASPSGTVCQCCHPSAAIGPDGRVAVLFRNSLDGNRDMYVAESQDGVTFGAPAKMGTGTWRLEACPMDGGGVALDRDGLVSIWRREGDVILSTPAVAERKLGVGRDPMISQRDQWRDVAWSAADGVRLSQQGAADTVVGKGRFPSVLARRDSTVIAWEHEGQVMVQRVAR